MGAYQIRVWTYWSGPRNALLDICEHSVERQVGNLWQPVTDDTVEDWIELPAKVKRHPSARTRSNYIRVALLYRYGGVWLDSDVLLLEDVTRFVGCHPVAWRENQEGRKRLQGFSPGIMASLPGDPFLRCCLDVLLRALKDTTISSMRYFHAAWKQAGEKVEVRGWRDFYTIPAKDWRRFWNEPSLLDLRVVGLHLWLSFIEPGTRRHKALRSVEAVRLEQPQSVLAEYVRRHMLSKGGPRK